MNKKRKVRRLPTGVALGRPETYANRRPVNDVPERTAFFNECYRRYLDFFHINVIDEMIETYRGILACHNLERKTREKVLTEETIQNYRWQCAPSVALRAAKALNEALNKRRDLMNQAREAALQMVEEKFGAAPGHDTAVTKEAAAEIPPPPKPELEISDEDWARIEGLLQEAEDSVPRLEHSTA